MAEDLGSKNRPPAKRDGIRPGAPIEPFAVAAPAVRPRPKQPAPAAATGDGLEVRLARAWVTHPIVEFFTHRSRLAFYRQLRSLLKSGAGVPVMMAELARWAPSRRMRLALATVQADIAAGSGLGEAMARHASLFDDATVELLMFAEESGSMERILTLLIDHLVSRQRTRWLAILGALWPAYLIAMMVFCAPLNEVSSYALANCHAAGCPPTSSFVHAYVVSFLHQLPFFLVPALLLGSFPFVLAAVGAEELWEQIKLATPGLSSVTRNGLAGRFFLTLRLAIGAGVEVTRSLRTSVKATGSAVLRRRVDGAIARVGAGGTLAEAVETLGVFDRVSIGTVAVGERTGQLEETLETLAVEHQAAAVRSGRILLVVVLAFVAIVGLGFVVSRIVTGYAHTMSHMGDQFDLGP